MPDPIVPAKFQNPDGTANVGGLAQSLQQLGGNPTQFMRPDGTFDVGSMSNAYTQMEQARNQPAPQPQAPAPQHGNTGGLQTTEPDTPAQVDWNAVTQEIATSGDVSPSTRSALAAAGIPESVLNQHITGIKAQAEVNLRRVADTIGGMQNYDRFVQWANANMSVDERRNLAVALNQPGGEFAIQGAFSRYQTAVQGGQWQPGHQTGIPGEPGDIQNVGGGGNAAPNVAAFASRTERRGAFKDPRYGVDPQYTQEVHERARLTHAQVKNDQQANATPSF